MSDELFFRERMQVLADLMRKYDYDLTEMTPDARRQAFALARTLRIDLVGPSERSMGAAQ